MKNFRLMALAGTLGVLAVATACSRELTVPNLNNPDQSKALSNPGDVRNVIGGAMGPYWNESQESETVGLSVTADEATGNFGNFSMRFNQQQPRIPYNNAPGNTDEKTALNPWQGFYGAIGSANDGIRAIKNGVKLNLEGSDQTAAYNDLADFVWAASVSELAMIYDKAFIPSDQADPVALTLRPFTEVRDSALARFDKVIASATGKNYTIATQYVEDLGGVGGLTGDKLAKYANSLAARTISQTSRNAAQNTAANWAKVLQYAEKGISTSTTAPGMDYSLTVTSSNPFGNNYTVYMNTDSWTRVDFRVIRAMDPTQPVQMNSTQLPPKATSPDARMGTDFAYRGNTIGDPTRGFYMLSPWAYQRYLYMARGQPNGFLGLTPNMISAENDLLIAEALIRTSGNLQRAVDMINKTRVGRGKLPAVTTAGVPASADCLPKNVAGTGCGTLLDAVIYERLLELYGTNVVVGWGDARRFDVMFPGSPRSLPVPGKELGTLRIANYSCGGVGTDCADPVP
ncbi:MAG: hypothetical protein JWO05_3593 [Gemmatimonadetes bacterium]|nr:hypothetical protein [Gemmatimonadota bacterium]